VPSVEEIKLHLAASVAETEQAAGAIRAVSDQLEEVLARLRLTAVGTVHPALMDAIVRLEQARLRLDEAHGLARGAVEAANGYRGSI
jgi:hypothetical protein